MLATLLLLTLSVPPDGPPAAVEHLTDLQGVWEVVGFTRDGNDEAGYYAGDRWAVVGDRVCVRSAPAGPKDMGRSRADPSADPPRVDRVTDDGMVYPGIYIRRGRELLWARRLDGGGRPAGFDAAAGSGISVWHLRRVD